MIVSCSWDKTIRQWNADTGVADNATGKPMEHSGEVWELAISTYGSVILSGMMMMIA